MKKAALVIALIGLLFSCKKTESIVQSAKDTTKSVSSVDTTLSKASIETLNKSLIFDLYLNFEWSDRNGNSSAILDFIPRALATPAKRIELQSKIGTTEMDGMFTYNAAGLLDTARCIVEGSSYLYIVNYTDKVVNQIIIGGAPKIKMKYDSQGRLQTLTREQSSTSTLEFTFVYAVASKTVYINLVVIEGTKRQKVSDEYYARWNDAYQLDAFRFNVYASSNIKYNATQNVASMTFSTVNNEVSMAWDYTSTDKSNNWTARNWKDASFTRVITY